MHKTLDNFFQAAKFSDHPEPAVKQTQMGVFYVIITH